MFKEKNFKSNTIRIAIGIMIFLAVFLVGGAEAATNISSCQEVSESGDYFLDTNISYLGELDCITITSSDVIFDGKNNTINGVSQKGSMGLQVFNSTISLSNLTVKNLKLTNWERGIELRSTSNSTLNSINVSNNTIGISIVSSDNNTLIDDTAWNNAIGILIFVSQNNTVISNKAENNEFGIGLELSSNNTFIDNNANSNNGRGISLIDSSNNTLTNNKANSNNGDIIGNGYGIYLKSSNNNTLSGNTANSNNVVNSGSSFSYGIYLLSSNNNTLSENNASSNEGYNNYGAGGYGYGIYLDTSSNNTLNGNNASSNKGYSSSGEGDLGHGIYLVSSNNNTLHSNNANSNSGSFSYGIYLLSSNNNTLSENNASSNEGSNTHFGMGNGYGIYLGTSSNNTLNGNNASSNKGYSAEVNGLGHGIYLVSSNNNTLNGNTVNSNIGEGISSGSNAYGIYMDASRNNTLNDNTANSNIGSCSGSECSSYAYGLYLTNSNNNTLLSNNATSNSGTTNGYGIYLYFSINNTFRSNNASSNRFGISIYNSNNNILIGNTANWNTLDGITLDYGTDSNTLNDNIAILNGRTGISLLQSINNIITNNTANLNNYGILLTQIQLGSSDNTFINNTVTKNTLWDFLSEQDSINNTVINLIIDPMTMISFTSKDVAIKSVLSPPSDPPNYRNISKFINVTNTSLDSWIFLNMSYSKSDVSNVQENTLSMWKHNGSSWSQVTGTNGVDTAQNYVYANISSFSIFAAMGIEGIPPASITELKNESYDPNFILWTWKNPSDVDFANVNIFIDGVFKENVAKGPYLEMNLEQDTAYTIATRTVDINGNINQTWVNHTARTSLKETPIVINITSPENNYYNKTGNVTVTVTLDRPGNAILNMDGINQTMDGSGKNFSSNTSGLLSGNHVFRVFANDSRGIYNVSETRVILVDRKESFTLPIDDTGKTTVEKIILAPSKNASIIISKGTEIKIQNSTNLSISCGNFTNISVDSLFILPSDSPAWETKNSFAGENLSAEPNCTNPIPFDAQISFVPDAQIRFNYRNDLDEEKLIIKYYNNITKVWKDAEGKLERHPSENYLILNTSHFTFFVLAIPAAAASSITTSNSGGSGGIGNTGIVSKEPADNIEKIETKTNYLAKEVPTTYKFNPQKGIYEIVITSINMEGDKLLRLEHLKGLSKMIKESAPDTVYYYANVLGGSESGITESLFRFKVENSWIKSNNIANVKMLKWDGSKWGGLETREINKDDIYTYFESRSNSLSQLSVVGVKAAVPQQVTQEEVNVSAIPPTVVPTLVQAEETFKVNFNYILVVLAIILVAAVIFIIATRTIKTPSSQQFIAKTREEYGEKYQEHLLEQYKLYVKIADKISERRQSANNSFLIFNSILICVFGILSGIEYMARHHVWQYLFPLAGLLVSTTWAALIGSSRHLQSIKLASIEKLESELPAALSNSEWKNSGEGKARQYVFFSYMEQFVPWIFTGIYIVLLFIALWNL